jgi:chemotaxis protein MotB
MQGRRSRIRRRGRRLTSMSTPTAELPPIIIKRKKAHAAHHGGAWKVAYADFVTAMMALFIVLWLMSASEETKKAIGGFFQDPSGKGREIGSGMAGSGESLSIKKDDMSKLKETLEQAVKQMPALDKIKDQVRLTVTGEGLRIELLETAAGTFFESGSPKPSAQCISVLTRLAEELGKLPNTILVEGHTDSKAFGDANSYNNWDLSTDRANMARRVLQTHGLRSDQVTQVRGFADQQPFKRADPGDPSNRRITVIVGYQVAPGSAAKVAEANHSRTEPSH